LDQQAAVTAQSILVQHQQYLTLVLVAAALKDLAIQLEETVLQV
jgi:hypothetical protein